MFRRTDLLSDLLIVDMSRIYTGPYCSQILSDLGATVIKIEPPSGDDTRNWGPPFLDEEGMSAYFAALNRNKYSIELDLNIVEDRKIFVQLVKVADVLIENFRRGVPEKLGITPKELWDLNKSLVYLSISAFGTDGPYKDHPSYDIIAQSESGIMGVTGTEEGEITKVGVPVGDIAGGMYGTIGILAALREVKKTGQGVHITTNLLSGLASWLTYQAMNAHYADANIQPLGTGHPNIMPYGAYRCGDGTWLSIAVGNAKLWKKFCKVLDREEWFDRQEFATNAARVEHRDLLTSYLKGLLQERPAREWFDLFRSVGVPVALVNGPLEVLDHPQLHHLGQIRTVEISGHEVPLIITPLGFSSGKDIPIRPPPQLDQDRSAVVRLLTKNQLKD